MSYAVLLTGLSLLAVCGFVGSLVIGPAALTVTTSLSALFGGDNDAARIVMQEIRLPRAILGAMIGATLGLTGAVLQGYLRNPLADPGVLGISATAAFGAEIGRAHV